MVQLAGLDQMHHRPQDDMWSDRRAVATTRWHHLSHEVALRLPDTRRSHR